MSKYNSSYNNFNNSYSNMKSNNPYNNHTEQSHLAEQINYINNINPASIVDTMKQKSELSESAYLDEEKKKQIIQNLDSEINEMRAKYFLKQPNEVKPISSLNNSHMNHDNNDNNQNYDPQTVHLTGYHGTFDPEDGKTSSPNYYDDYNNFVNNSNRNTKNKYDYMSSSGNAYSYNNYDNFHKQNSEEASLKKRDHSFHQQNNTKSIVDNEKVGNIGFHDTMKSESSDIKGIEFDKDFKNEQTYPQQNNVNVMSFDPKYFNKNASNASNMFSHNSMNTHSPHTYSNTIYSGTGRGDVDYNTGYNSTLSNIKEGSKTKTASYNIKVNKESTDYDDFMKGASKNDLVNNLQREDNEVLIDQ